MAMHLENVVPFGRSRDEYERMFQLRAADLDRRILGVADGPASFNAEMHQLGKSVISVDPLYVFEGPQIQLQFDAAVGSIIAQVKASPGDWVWSYHRSPDQLRQNREQVLRRFLADYEAGRAQGRYLVGTLPTLDFKDGQFELALCSHFLFLYSAQLDYSFHRAAVFEMLRVAAEVRIFPLLTLMRQTTPHLPPLLAELRAAGFFAVIEGVDYELQRGGNEMLRIRRKAQVSGGRYP